MSDFIKTIQETINSIYKLSGALTGSLAADESLKLASMLAYVREKEADARAIYHASLWEKLQEKKDDEPISFSKAEAYAKAQPDYHEFLRMQGLAEALLELTYGLRIKAKNDDADLKAQP